MHPIICTIGPFTVYSYGLALVIGFLAAVSLAQVQARRTSVDPEFVFNFAFLVFISGVVGARVLFILYNFHYYLKNPVEIVMLQHGGLAWFGGLLGGIFSGIVYARRKAVPVYIIMDLIVPFVALAQAVGRIGCFLNGCCYGKAAAAFCIFSPHQDACLIPTQLYSTFFLLVIFFVLRFLQERPHKSGEIFYAYLMLYATKRFVVEFFRADNPPVLWNFTIFHLFCIAVFSVAAILFIRIKKCRQ